MQLAPRQGRRRIVDHQLHDPHPRKSKRLRWVGSSRKSRLELGRDPSLPHPIGTSQHPRLRRQRIPWSKRAFVSGRLSVQVKKKLQMQSAHVQMIETCCSFLAQLLQNGLRGIIVKYFIFAKKPAVPVPPPPSILSVKWVAECVCVCDLRSDPCKSSSEEKWCDHPGKQRLVVQACKWLLQHRQQFCLCFVLLLYLCWKILKMDLTCPDHQKTNFMAYKASLVHWTTP